MADAVGGLVVLRDLPFAGELDRADGDRRAVGVELPEAFGGGDDPGVVEPLLEGLLEVEHRAVVGDGDLEGETGLGAVDDLSGHRRAPPWVEKKSPNLTIGHPDTLHQSSVTPAKQVGANGYSTFVAMPFKEGDDYQSKAVFDNLICAAAARANDQRRDLRPFAKPHRVDENAGVAVVITEEIIVNILESHFVVADLTLGNVGAVLEAGAAFGLKPNKQIILLHNGDYSRLHFDIRNNKVIKYDCNDDPAAIDKIAGAFIAAAQSFEDDGQRRVDFVKRSLSPDAVQWLRIYARLWKEHSQHRPSLHRGGVLDSLEGGKFPNDPTAHIVFINGTHELLSKRLMYTEYDVDLNAGIDHFGMQATSLGRAVIKQMWGAEIPPLD